MFYRHFVRILNFSKDKYRMKWYGSYYMGPKTQQKIFEILLQPPDGANVKLWFEVISWVKFTSWDQRVIIWLGVFFWKSGSAFPSLPIQVFIDAINGNLVNSLLRITIEIQMKGEYVVFVRFPNRFCPILCRITVLIQLKPIFYSF